MFRCILDVIFLSTEYFTVSGKRIAAEEGAYSHYG